MNPGCSNPEHSSGFSLIELMLAMLIGLIIMGGVMQLFITTRDTQRSNEDQLVLVADARFAIEAIAYDLRHTGLWGRHNDSFIIACQKGGANAYPCPTGATMPMATADCKDEEYINLGAPLFATNDVNPYPGTCANQSYKTGTDVLSLRYADTNRIGTNVLADDVAYIRTSTSVGMLFIGDTFPVGTPYNELNDPSTRSSNHLLVSRIYYVSDYTDAVGDGQPSLRRGDLVAGPAMDSVLLLPGVEDFQLEFGVDLGSNGAAGKKDGQVDSYVNADNVTDWSNGEVLSVRIWVLIRTKRPDRDGIGSAQTFTYAGKTVTIPNDGYSRRLISSVVKLRNTFQVNLKKAGS